jgi:two-component sensor histidine kinase
MSNTRQRIGALALIYRALYQGPDLKRVDLRSFLEELIAQVLASDAAQHPAFRTELEADDLVVDPDKLAPIALFAVEAISNAQKHAFGPQGGSLRVRFTLEGEEGVLEISDEGGRGQPPELTEGVGRTLMIAFARQLRGRADIAPNARGGVTARLVFPAPEGQIQPKRPAKKDQAAA